MVNRAFAESSFDVRTMAVTVDERMRLFKERINVLSCCVAQLYIKSSKIKTGSL